MGWFNDMNKKIKHRIRNWLQIQNIGNSSIEINQFVDFELNAIRNTVWYRGDSSELEQLHSQIIEGADKYKFWASKSSPGMEIRKIHTGLPGLMVDTIASIVLTDMNIFEFKNPKHQLLWESILKDNTKDNKFDDLLENAIKDCLVVGDGAFKVSIDTEISNYPIIEWVPGNEIELIKEKGRLKEIIFKTANKDGTVLLEHRGKGYIRYSLYKNDSEMDIKTNKYTSHLKEFSFDKSLMLAVPFKISSSKKYNVRGGSIFDSKIDNFDAFDEIWSQWMDAQRAGRAIRYIPESLLPRNPFTGEIMSPNYFDNRYIKTDSDMGENSKNEINIKQATIPHDSYLSAYITALDLCLQGILSPSTLGIDVKKLDNADAQREKEKTTLYTRNKVVKAVQDRIPDLISTCLNAYNILLGKPIEEINVDIPFGEYANPSFESQVETIGKAKVQGIMSVEACIDELYGDTKTREWKQGEVKRIKSEQGIESFEEPSLNLDGVILDE